MKAVIYGRISREEQSVYSLEEQVKECKRYIENEGHEWIDTYIDDGYSAKDLHRPSLQQMLEDIKARKFGLIVIWKLDRLTRDTLDGLSMVKNIFKPNGIAFASKTEDIDTSTPDGYMMFTIRLSMAQAEREKIRERVIMGQTARARTGKRNSSIAPYGYRCGEDLKLEVVEEEAEVVRLIYQWYLEGDGKPKICTRLTEMGISPPKGAKIWYTKTIMTILGNYAYYGASDWKQRNLPESDRIIIENTHEPIIPRDVWDKAQDYTRRKREHSMSQSSHDFPFSTIVKCALCGSSFHGRYTKRTGNEKHPHSRIYFCRSRVTYPVTCDSSSISERKLTKLIFDTIHFDLPEMDLNKPVDKTQPDVAKERTRLLKELEKSKDRQMKLAKAMSSGAIDFDIYAQLREEEKSKCASWEDQLAALPKDQQAIDTIRVSEIMEELRRLKQDWHTWSYAEQKIRVQKIFKRIVVTKVGKAWQIEEVEIHA